MLNLIHWWGTLLEAKTITRLSFYNLIPILNVISPSIIYCFIPIIYISGKTIYFISRLNNFTFVNLFVMQDEDYQDTLKDAVRILHDAEIEIFTAMVNVGFKGAYDEISKLHEVGEVLNLEIAMFENTGDANLDTLVKIVKEISRTKHQLININGLDIELEDDIEL
jgi:hypothetical protein